MVDVPAAFGFTRVTRVPDTIREPQSHYNGVICSNPNSKKTDILAFYLNSVCS